MNLFKNDIRNFIDSGTQKPGMYRSFELSHHQVLMVLTYIRIQLIIQLW